MRARAKTSGALASLEDCWSSRHDCARGLFLPARTGPLDLRRAALAAVHVAERVLAVAGEANLAHHLALRARAAAKRAATVLRCRGEAVRGEPGRQWGRRAGRLDAAGAAALGALAWRRAVGDGLLRAEGGACEVEHDDLRAGGESSEAWSQGCRGGVELGSFEGSSQRGSIRARQRCKICST